MTYDPERRRVHKRDLARRYDCSRRTIDNRIARGALPQPHRDELGRCYWWDHEIAQHELKLEQEAAA